MDGSQEKIGDTLDGEVKEIGESQFEKLIYEEKKVIVVYFYSPTCPICKEMDPVFEKLAEDMGDGTIFRKVNAASATALAGSLGIRGVPTFKILCKGKVIGELNGAVYHSILRSTIKEVREHADECGGRVTEIKYDFNAYA